MRPAQFNPLFFLVSHYVSSPICLLVRFLVLFAASRTLSGQSLLRSKLHRFPLAVFSMTVVAHHITVFQSLFFSCCWRDRQRIVAVVVTARVHSHNYRPDVKVLHCSIFPSSALLATYFFVPNVHYRSLSPSLCFSICSCVTDSELSRSWSLSSSLSLSVRGHGISAPISFLVMYLLVAVRLMFHVPCPMSSAQYPPHHYSSIVVFLHLLP